MEAALKAFERWRKVSWKERVDLIIKTSKIIGERRLEFNAWLVFVVGKNWEEADADVCESIDILELYGR